MVCLILLGVATAYHYQIGPFKKDVTDSTINLHPSSEEQKKSGADIKQNSASNPDDKQNSSGSDQPTTPIAQEGSSKGKIDMTITAANQSGSMLQIRTLIGALVNTGTCTLVLTSALNSSVTKSSEVQPQSNTSTCKGFDVSTTELSPGEWKATITYDSDTLTGSASTTISIKV